MLKRILKLIGLTAVIALPLVASATTIGVQQGGTGSTTLSGLLKGAGINAVSTAIAGTDYQAPITLTTTGSSGAATFSNNILNIPQYSGGSSGIGTSAPISGGNLLEYSASGAGSAFGVGTSTPSIGSVVTYSGTLGNFVGGTSGTFGIANSAITNAMLVNSSATVNTGGCLTGGGTLTLGSSLSLNTTCDTFAYPWTTATNFGASRVASTTGNGPIWLQNGLYASTTLIADNATTTNATTTNLKVSGTTNLGLGNALVLSGSTGNLSAYGGASSCAAHNFFTGLSATGGSTCGTDSVTVNGTVFNFGDSNTITANTTNSLTFSNSGGAAVNSTFNGGSALTVDYSTIGAIGTSSPWTNGQLAEVTSGKQVTGVSTSTPSIGSVLTYSGTLGNFVGGTSGTFGIANSAVTNAMLANSTISGISLGSNLNALTIGTGLSGGSYNGSAAATIALLSYLATSSAETANYVPAWNTTSGTPAKLTGGDNTFVHFPGAAVGIGSSTPFGQLGVGTTTSQNAIPLFNVGSSTVSNVPLQVNGFGKTVVTDQVNNWTGVVSPTRAFVLSAGTTTQWVASTTGSAYSPYLIMPFAGTLRAARCVTESSGSFLGVNVQVNGSNATPSYFVASTTVGTESFTSGNTFTAGQKILANFGTTTNDGTQTNASVSCTFTVTETP